MVEHSAQHVQGPESNPQHLKKKLCEISKKGKLIDKVVVIQVYENQVETGSDF